METSEKCHCRKTKRGTSSGLYGLGLVGALIFYLQQVDTFGAGVMAVLKAIVWPALLVYKLLG